MNVDTDTQFAYLEGIRNFVLEKKDYLMSQVGNPEKPDGSSLFSRDASSRFFLS